MLSFSLLVALAGSIVFQLQSNIKREPLNLAVVSPLNIKPILPDRDVAVDPTNILILGTDTRKGNGEYGREEDSSGYGSSDVMLLLHLYADKKSATVVSFPRDLMAPLPSCQNPETGVISASLPTAQLNNALKTDGPGCTVAAISELTGLTIDHMMLADFNAVKELSKTIGGVEVCVTQAVDDEKSGLKIPAGVSEVEGEQALSFLRTRSAFGDGSDLGRIRAQQSFLASLARKVTSNDTLTDIPKLYSIANTITKNLTVDEGLAEIPELVKIADRMKKLDLGKVQFITVPTEPYVADPNRVQIIPQEAEPIFASLEKDILVGTETIENTPMPTTDAEPTAEPTLDGTTPAIGEETMASTELPIEIPLEEGSTPSPSETAPVKIDPSLINVNIENRSGKDNRSEEVQALLKTIGYIATVGEESQKLPSSQVLYAYGDKELALQVASDLGIAASQVQHSLDVTMVTVSIGSDFTSGNKIYSSSELDPSLQGQTASDVTCNVS